MISLVLLALGSSLVLAQPASPSTPFTRLTQTVASTPFAVSSPGVVTPSTTSFTSPVLASMNPSQLSSTLQFPQSLNNQLNIPNIQGLSQPSFTDPFAPSSATTSQTNSGLLSGMLPSGLSNSINGLTSPFTNVNAAPGSATTPITSSLSNLFGSAPVTTTTLTSPFSTSNPIQTSAPANTNMFPLDSTLFPSAFSTNTAPTTSMLQTQPQGQPQAPQLSTLSSNPPNFQSNNVGPQAPSSPFASQPQPQAPTQPRAPTQPQAPSAPFSPSQPQAPGQPQAPSITGFNPAAINGPSIPSTGFSTQATPPQAPQPGLSNNSPFGQPQAPAFPSGGINAPVGNAPSPSLPQQPSGPSGPILLESGSTPVRQAAPVVVRGNAPAMSPFPSSPQLP